MSQQFWVIIFLILFFDWLKLRWGRSSIRPTRTAVVPPVDFPKPPPPPPEGFKTAEERMEWELAALRSSFQKRALNFSTTLMRLKSLAACRDRDEVFSIVLETLAKGLPAKNVYFLIKATDGSGLIPVRVETPTPANFRNKKVPRDEKSILGFLGRGGDPGMERLARPGSVLGTHDVAGEPALRSLSDGAFPTSFAAPLYVGDTLFGVVGVECQEKDGYTWEDADLLATVVEIAGKILAGALRIDQAERSLGQAAQMEADLKSSLSRIVSPQVAEMIMAAPDQVKPSMRETTFSLVLMDIRWKAASPVQGGGRDGGGGPPASGKGLRGAGELRKACERWNRFLGTVAQVVREFDGTLDCLSPLRVVIAFGIPVATGNHALRGVLGALKILEVLQESAECRSPDEVGLEVALAVDSGTGMEGYFGGEQSLSYSAFSLEAAEISRNFPAFGSGKVWISGRTKPVVDGFFTLAQEIQISDAGSGRPLGFFEVTGLQPGVSLQEALSTSPLAEPGVPEPGLTPEMPRQNLVLDPAMKTVSCANCGNVNPNVAKFCEKCGMPVF